MLHKERRGLSQVKSLRLLHFCNFQDCVWCIPYLPAYRPHFFQGKKRSKFGVRLIRGYKSFELINMQNFPTHTESTK